MRELDSPRNVAETLDLVSREVDDPEVLLVSKSLYGELSEAVGTAVKGK